MIYIFMIGMIFFAEYYTKRHMDHVRTLQEQRPMAGGKIILKKYYNSGGAGNFLKSHPKCIRSAHISTLLAASAALLYVMPKKNTTAAKTGLSLLVGGGFSNLYDRLTKGYVVDYVSFGFGPKRFQKLVFNFADFFIFSGILLCAVQSLKEKN